jgi:hypothetical protein
VPFEDTISSGLSERACGGKHQNWASFCLCDSLEAVDVQLPLKGLVFGLVEVSWQDDFGKFLGFVDPERVSVHYHMSLVSNHLGISIPLMLFALHF